MFPKRQPFIQVDNIEGTYYTQWRIEELIRVAEEIQDFYSNITRDFHVYYDSRQDYHCLRFNIGEIEVLIEYYKIFSLKIKGENSHEGMYFRKNFGHSSYNLTDFIKSPDFHSWCFENFVSGLPKVEESKVTH